MPLEVLLDILPLKLSHDRQTASSTVIVVEYPHLPPPEASTQSIQSIQRRRVVPSILPSTRTRAKSNYNTHTSSKNLKAGELMGRS